MHCGRDGKQRDQSKAIKKNVGNRLRPGPEAVRLRGGDRCKDITVIITRVLAVD